MFGFDIPTQIQTPLVESLVLLLVVISGRMALVAALGRGKEQSESLRRRVRSLVQNAASLVILVGLAFIWSPQLANLALSLTAFAVALVFATKEFLLCLTGALYRGLTRPYAVGDFIELGELHGEVIGEGLLSIRIRLFTGHEGHFDLTGRVVTAPNSLLLTEPLINETYRRNMVRHSFEVALTTDANLDAARAAAEAAAATAAAPHLELAERYFQVIARRIDAPPAPVEPSVHVATSTSGEVVLRVRVACPPEACHQIHTDVTIATLKAAYR